MLLSQTLLIFKRYLILLLIKSEVEHLFYHHVINITIMNRVATLKIIVIMCICVRIYVCSMPTDIARMYARTDMQ